MDWEGLISDVFTPKVDFDNTSLGGDAQQVSSKSIVEGWKEGFKGLESVHHQIGNLRKSSIFVPSKLKVSWPRILRIRGLQKFPQKIPRNS